MSNILQQIGAAVKGKVDGVQANVDAEETARIAAVSAEATARGNADTTLQSNIDAEESRATAAEGTLTTNLNSEISDRQAAVTAEASARSSADSTLQSNIDAEASTARAAESQNASDIADEESRATAAEATLTTNLNSEISDRQAAVTAEATARSNADTALQTEIDAEETRAQAAEGVLTTNLNSEISDRQAAVTAEANTRAAAVANLDTIKANLAGAAFTGDVSGTNLTLSGNLTVQGTTTSLETVNSQVKDSIMLLNDGAADSSNNANDVGLIMERGSSEDNVALVFDEGEDKFVCYKTSATSSSTDISGDDASATLMDIKVNDVHIGSDNLGSLAEFTAALG